MIRILSEKIHRYRFLISASSTALKPSPFGDGFSASGSALKFAPAAALSLDNDPRAAGCR
jgi:hypothetical protein